MVMNLRLLFICKQAKKIDRDRIEETKAYLETEMQIRFRDFEINCWSFDEQYVNDNINP